MLRPTTDRILIERESVQKPGSMIVLPEEVDKINRPARGVVKAVGPTAGYIDPETDVPLLDVYPGDRVIFGRHAGVEVEENGVKFWLVAYKDILCKIEEDVKVEE
jgi:chaperonin GroES